MVQLGGGICGTPELYIEKPAFWRVFLRTINRFNRYQTHSVSQEIPRVLSSNLKKHAVKSTRERSSDRAI